MLIGGLHSTWSGGYSPEGFVENLSDFPLPTIPGICYDFFINSCVCQVYVIDVIASDVWVFQYKERNAWHEQNPTAPQNELWNGKWWISPEGSWQDPVLNWFDPTFGNYPLSMYFFYQHIPLQDCIMPGQGNLLAFCDREIKARGLVKVNDFFYTNNYIPQNVDINVLRNFFERMRNGQIAGRGLYEFFSQDVYDLHNPFQFPTDAHDIKESLREFACTDYFRTMYYNSINGLYFTKWQVDLVQFPGYLPKKTPLSPIENFPHRKLIRETSRYSDLGSFLHYIAEREEMEELPGKKERAK